MKRWMALLLAFLICLMGGCAESEVTPAQSAEDPAASDLIVLAAGRFASAAFCDSSIAATRLSEEYGLTVTTVECTEADYEAKLRDAANRSPLVVCAGEAFACVGTVAAEFPEVRFIWADAREDVPLDNVLSITFAKNESAFLAGYAAAAMSLNYCIGAIGREGSPAMVGYTQGAQCFNPDVRVETVSGEDDPTGKTPALSLHELGADVIFQAEPSVGDGLFEAAREEGFLAIGADFGKKDLAPEAVLAFTQVEMGQAIYEAVSAYVAGDTSRWGTTWRLGLSGGYVGLGYGDDAQTQLAPNPLKQQIETLTGSIIRGEIVVADD